MKSVLMTSAVVRAAIALAIVAALWLAVAWALRLEKSLPGQYRRSDSGTSPLPTAATPQCTISRANSLRVR